jgi:hypothetical protein
VYEYPGTNPKQFIHIDVVNWRIVSFGGVW